MGKSSVHKKNNEKYGPDPNKSNKDIVKEFIKSYPLNLEMDTLLTNSVTNRRHKKMQKIRGNPPRPLNPYILYRRDKMASPEFKNRPAKDKRAKDISKEIANCWNSETNEIKKFFYALARIAEKKHGEKFKNYEYKKPKNKQKTRKTENENESSISSSSSPTESLMANMGSAELL